MHTHTHTATGSSSASAVPQASSLDVLLLRNQLQLYNSMSRKKEPFTTRPTSPETVQMYVCGVTVYDYSHIGACAYVLILGHLCQQQAQVASCNLC